jgi:isopenicillin N synthase-like dioxygenase
MSAQAEIPVVSLASLQGGDDAGTKLAARDFGSALEDIGFVTIVDHGVPAKTVGDLYNLAHRFFARPIEQKLECMLPDKAKPTGYIPMGAESVAATLHGEEAPDLCEALVFIPPEQDGRIGRRNLWPRDFPELEAAVTGYFRALAALASNLYRISEIALELPAGFFSPYFREPSFTLRLVNYPEQITPPRPGQLRYGAHHDYGGLTILHQDAAPGGLQVRDRSGAWRDVPHRPGAFVINVGDLLSRWTNDRWRSTLHRVVNPARDAMGPTQRLSVVFFTGPDRNSEIEVLPTCVSDRNPAKYPPVVAGDYVRAKILASHDLKLA